MISDGTLGCIVCSEVMLAECFHACAALPSDANHVMFQRRRVQTRDQGRALDSHLQGSLTAKMTRVRPFISMAPDSCMSRCIKGKVMR